MPGTHRPPPSEVGQEACAQERLEALLQATQSIAADLDLKTVLHRIVEAGQSVVRADVAALGLAGRDGGLTEVVHGGGVGQDVQHIADPMLGEGLLSELLRRPRPVRLRSLGAPAEAGFPAGHPHPGSFLAVPVRARGRLLGVLCLAGKQGAEEFSAEDEQLALALAAAAAVAVDNARLFEAASRREHWLEVSRETTNELIGTPDIESALRLLTTAVRSCADADLAAVIVTDTDGLLRVAAIDGPGTGHVLGGVVPAGAPGTIAIREGVPVLLEDLQAHPELEGPMRRHGIGPLAAVPLAAHDQVLGAVVIGNMPGRRQFTPDDVQMVGDFATHVALVLLSATTRATTMRLQMVAERARMAHELHDNALQGIFSVGLSLNSLAVRTGGETAERLIALADQLDDAIRAVRQSIFALRSQGGETNPGELRALLSDVTHAATDALGFPATLSVDGPVDTVVPEDLVEDLLAVLEEALSNAAQHAGAHRVDVHVVASDGLILEVRDDGRGIGTPSRSGGLAAMRTRAERRGGRLDVIPGASGGTVVRWEVPWAVPAPRPGPEESRRPDAVRTT